MLNPLFLSLILGMGCQTEVTQTETILPQIYLSDYDLDFGEVGWGETVSRTVYIENQGELPMGIRKIELATEGFEDNFDLQYYTDVFNCQESPETATTGTTDTATSGEAGNTTSLTEGEFILPPTCSLAIEVSYTPNMIGEAYASFHIESFIEEPPTEADGTTNVAFTPSFYRDPVDFKETIILHGYSAQGNGNIKISPRTVDFGHLWTGEQETRQIMINNIGDGDLTIGTPYLGEDCKEEEFSLNLDTLDDDNIIPAGHGTIFEATFTPTSTDTTYCSLYIPSDDADSPELEVRLKGNLGRDPNNEAPQVTLISPPVGYVHNAATPLQIELSMFDVNQPANTLLCKVKSMGQGSGTYPCSPEDESGYVTVDIPTENLAAGTDSFMITVTDQSELRSFASTTIVFGSDFPPSDDDGDGYGVEGELVDCDDNDSSVYPYAAEIADGKDNDCDTMIDENTLAGDDDGDSVTEKEGDCDDADPNTYPSAPELPDLRDNDCDGLIDETTSLYDDDGDGFAEVDNDCNDRDPNISPAAVEICDGIDNNCNNLRDQQEGCLTIDSEPVIIGGIQMESHAISVGETTTMTLFVHELDGQEISYKWEEDSIITAMEHVAISDPTAKTITWTAPDTVDGEGQAFSVYVLVTDEDGNQDWVFDEISVYSSPVPQVLVQSETAAAGCNSSSALFPVFFGSLFGLLSWRRRRS